MAGRASLLLSDALVQWSDSARVNAVLEAERKYMHSEVCGFYRDHPALSQLSDDAELDTDFLRMNFEKIAYATLDGAWNKLVRDFRRRNVDCRLFLQGVAIRPKPATTPMLVPGAWVADGTFDFNRDRLAVGRKVYGSVTVFRTRPVPPATNSGPHSMTPGPITAESVRRLTYDEMLLLFEEEHRRVIEEPDAKLGAPGEKSLMPLVAAKMRHRAASGALLPTRKAEARLLAEWVAEKAPKHQTPTAATIEKVLGNEYAVLRERSKAANQSPKG